MNFCTSIQASSYLRTPAEVRLPTRADDKSSSVSSANVQPNAAKVRENERLDGLDQHDILYVDPPWSTCLDPWAYEFTSKINKRAVLNALAINAVYIVQLVEWLDQGDELISHSFSLPAQGFSWMNFHLITITKSQPYSLDTL